MSAVSVGDVRRVLDEAYPPHLAEKWDAVGLICGDPAAEVKRVAFAPVSYTHLTLPTILLV